jgi:hypothetical protein
VRLKEEDGKDEFYIFQQRDLQEYCAQVYKGGRRPKNPQTMHCAVRPEDLQQFHENWALVERVFEA